MTKTVNVIHKQRTNTAANWSASNPILLAGQIGVVSGTSPTRFKVGDGTTAWNSLPYSDEDWALMAGTAATLASLPIDKRAMVVTISAAQATFTYAATPPNNFQQTILLKNSTGTAITQAIPNSGSWKALDGASVIVPANGSIEINVWYIDSIYRVAVKA